MGLGKTLQTIAFIAHLYEQGIRGPFLIIAPLSTIQNWYNEFQRFTPDIPAIVYHGAKEERDLLRDEHFFRGNPAFPVVLTSYQIIMK
jgi:ATP-dependent DNA helicase